jgi:hypothetical protein
MLVNVDRYQKLKLWCQLLRSADTKNQFSKIKKNPELRSRPMRPRSEPTVIKLLLADTAVGHH